LGIYVAVAGLQRKRIKAACDAEIAIAGVGVERAIEIGTFDAAIAGVKADVAVNRGGGNVAIAGVKVNVAGDTLGGHVSVAGLNVEIEIAWDVQLNLYGFVVAAKEGPVEVRRFHADDYVVSALAFFYANVAGTDLITLGDDVRVDLFLLGAHDGYVAIVSGNAEIGASTYLVGLGPVVGARWSSDGCCEK
jgi:hypothetical protein